MPNTYLTRVRYQPCFIERIKPIYLFASFSFSAVRVFSLVPNWKNRNACFNQGKCHNSIRQVYWKLNQAFSSHGKIIRKFVLFFLRVKYTVLGKHQSTTLWLNSFLNTWRSLFSRYLFAFLWSKFRRKQAFEYHCQNFILSWKNLKSVWCLYTYMCVFGWGIRNEQLVLFLYRYEFIE